MVSVCGLSIVCNSDFVCLPLPQYLVLDGDVSTLADMFAVSFLSVMGLFAVGNMLLKVW